MSAVKIIKGACRSYVAQETTETGGYRVIARYVTKTTIARIEERFERRVLSGVGKDADVATVSTGWWIVTQSPEPYAFKTGKKRPEHKVGEEIRLIIEVGGKP